MVLVLGFSLPQSSYADSCKKHLLTSAVAGVGFTALMAMLGYMTGDEAIDENGEMIFVRPNKAKIQSPWGLKTSIAVGMGGAMAYGGILCATDANTPPPQANQNRLSRPLPVEGPFSAESLKSAVQNAAASSAGK